MESIRNNLVPLRSSTAFITFVIAFSVYTDQFLYAAIVPVTPFALQQRGQVPDDKVQLWTAILLAVFGVGCFLSSPPWAWFTDNFKNRRVPFLAGLLVLLGATVLLWLASDIEDQVIGRILQGIASTVVWTTGMAVLVDTVGNAQIGEYSGYIGIALNAGSLSAPLMGGIIFERCGYSAVFGLILGVIGLDIIFRLIMKEKNIQALANTLPGAPLLITTDSDSTSDVESAASSVRKVRSVQTERLSTAADKGYVSKAPTIVPSVAPSAVPSMETLSTSPTARIPAMIRLLFSTRFCVALWGITVLAATFSGFETILPLTVHDTFGWNAEGGGLIFLPLSLPALFGPLVGRVTDKYGGRWFVAGAFLLLLPSLVLLRLVECDSIGQRVLLCALLVITGSCLTVILEPLFAEITLRATELETEERSSGTERRGCNRGYYGQAYGHFNMAWALGNTVGPLLCGLVVDAAGWPTATLSLGILCGVTAIPLVLWCDGWLFAKRH